MSLPYLVPSSQPFPMHPHREWLVKRRLSQLDTSDVQHHRVMLPSQTSTLVVDHDRPLAIDKPTPIPQEDAARLTSQNPILQKQVQTLLCLFSDSSQLLAEHLHQR